MNRKRVASKFNLLIVLSVVICVAISSASITVFLLQRYSKDVVEKDRLHMKGLASSVKGFIDHAFSLNYLLSISPEIVEDVVAADPEWAQRVAGYNQRYDTTNGFSARSGLPLLVSTQSRYDFVELFFVQDAGGNQTSRSFGPLGRRGQRWWFRKITENRNYRPFMSKSYYSMTGDKPVASAFHPIYDGDAFVGVMGTDINFDKLQGMVRNYLDTADLYAVVVDPEGVIIAHPDKNKLRELYNLNKLTRNVLIRNDAGVSVQDQTGHHQTEEVKLDWDQRVSKIVAEALGGNSGMAENVILESKRSTIYYEPIELPGDKSGQNYALLLIRDNSTLTKAKLTILAFVLLFTGSALFTFIFLFRLQFRRIVLKPLEVLVKSMNSANISRHDDVILGTHDEFQLLGDSYNQMHRNLVQTNEQLSEINDKLELLVEERTAELKLVNRRLREDIAKREQIEKALQQSEERYRTLVENTLDGYFICQVPSGRFLFLNQGICKLSGYSMQEGLGLTMWDVIDPQAHDRITQLIQARLDGRFMRFDRHIYPAIRKDGTVFRAEVSTSLVTFQGQTAIQGVLRDITEQERLQEQLQQGERMQAIGTLAGGIAHDFNNLLMGIQGRTSLMLMDVNDAHPFTPQLKGIEEHVKRAVELTSQLLGFARGGKYEVAPLNLNDLIRENIIMFARTKKELSIDIELAEDTWPVEADRSQIDQVLLNLYVNAWQAMPGGGRLKVRTHNRRLGESFVEPFQVPAGKYVEIAVSDTGVGMDDETCKHIFDPFFTTKERGRGTGLGLASAYGIIENHDGVITVQSRKGHGTTFTIYLPASDKFVNEVGIESSETLSGAGTVLLIDDEEMILEVGAALLKKLGYRVRVASGGRQGLNIYRQNPAGIDLVILDMVMPGMNGSDTFEQLRKINPQVKVLLSSGYSKDGIVSDMLNRISPHFIQKPFDINKLSQKIREALKRSGVED